MPRFNAKPYYRVIWGDDPALTSSKTFLVRDEAVRFWQTISGYALHHFEEIYLTDRPRLRRRPAA